MKAILLIGITGLISIYSYSQTDQEILREIKENMDGHISLYQHFHQYPELSFEEYKTADRLSTELEKLGFDISRNIGGNGFVGIYNNGEGPVVMLRTDMDALPLEEKTALPFASKVPGVMHACGHDLHMTVWLGTAKVLTEMKDSWSGTLMMVAQQAEEKSGGAIAMIDDGIFKRFQVPDYALAYHVSSELEVGTVGYRAGPFLAGVNSVDIRVKGVGGHGARPNIAVDPVVLAARMILAYQTIHSREINPVEPSVVTVGSIHGGTVHNIIPDEVKMQLTVRFFNDEVYAQIIEALERISIGIAQSAGLPESLYPEIIPADHLTPPLVNDDRLITAAIHSFTSVLGEENVIEVEPVTVGEDFARFGRSEEQVPIAMFWLGSVNPVKYNAHINKGTPLAHLHNPEFFPDFEPSYKTGVLGMTKVILDLFKQ